MTIIMQGTKLLQILITIVLCSVISVPVWASENPESPLRVAAIIDQPVFNSEGQELGELEDFVIKRNGTVKKALISVGGILDVGDKLVPAKYRSVKFTGEKITIDVTKKQLNERPQFDYREHGLFTNYHYRLHPYGIMPGPGWPRGRALPPGYQKRWEEEDEGRPSDRQYYRFHGADMPGRRYWYDPWKWAYYPAQMLASVIIGQTVVNKQGEEVATLEDLVISSENRIETLILSYGGFLDIDDKLVAVPYRPIGFTKVGITYDITKRELENQPKFKKD